MALSKTDQTYNGPKSSTFFGSQCEKSVTDIDEM